MQFLKGKAEQHRAVKSCKDNGEEQRLNNHHRTENAFRKKVWFRLESTLLISQEEL
jgi:hypothetical protein